ncbi:YcgN family cysteine cluster protein [Rubellimicrobium arenae]|uniref:YcgN family cysteine cluster protein n=1 Tax=Rubellimicrobium arenae TaxID=2817372 RepID=UPI001B303D31|nr:YcgN family cysteine cluster protein [Rubellimicrobium arenae]
MPDDHRPRFWELPLKELTRPEWEALCDGCGKCCLNKLEDEDTGEVALTNVACRLLDGSTCQCSKYATRHDFVPECIVLTPRTIRKNMYWLPQTCAYRLRFQGRPLPDWHPLLTGDPASVHKAGVSVAGLTVSEYDVADEDWENHIIEEPGT